jgi:mannitol-1-phosphate/altronate dehydrogenase
MKLDNAHLGVGGFHQAHRAMYLDRLMNQGQAVDWAICAMGVMPSDAHMRDVRHTGASGNGTATNSWTSWPHDSQVLDRTASGPLTCPRTVFGLVCAGLQLRRERGITPFTVMSCDNIQGNGHVAERMFTAYAQSMNPEPARWMRINVPFPSSMVDRITPETTHADLAAVAARGTMRVTHPGPPRLRSSRSPGRSARRAPRVAPPTRTAQCPRPTPPGSHQDLVPPVRCLFAGVRRVIVGSTG